MPKYSKIAAPLAELLSKMPAGSRAAQEAIAAEMAARKAAQEAAYAPHTLPTEKGKKTIAKAKKTLGKEDEAVQAPSVIIPSKVSNVEQAIRQSKGEYGAKRVQRAADNIPNLGNLYTEKALTQAFGGDNAKALMAMNPADFEEFAHPILELETRRRGIEPNKANYPTEEYIKYLSELKGFDDVPFLQINKEEQGLPLIPYISGHEGRHRSRALANREESAGLVQLLPRAELREPFPRRSQEEYLEALLKELEMTGNLVLPEKYFPADEYDFNKQIQRPAKKLPPLFADGGAVNMPNFFNTEVNFGGNQPNIPVPEINVSMLGQVSKAKGGVVNLDDLVHNAMQRNVQKMAGGGRTRAGTPASPTPLDEQIERTKKRFKGFMDDPDQELRNIARQYFPSDTDTPEERSQKLEDLAMGFAGTTIGKVPRMSKAQSIEAGLYHPVGRGKKLTRPVNEVEFTRAPDPNMPIAPKKIITPEDLFDKQGYPVTWDPSAAGELLTGMRGKLFQEPVVLQGGEGYQRTHGGLQSPQKLAVASHPGVIKRHSNIIKRIASEGDEPVSVVLAMSPGHSLDYNKMIAQTLMQEIKNSKISSKLAKEFDEEVRKQFPNFVGIKNKKLDKQLNSDTSGNLRKYVADRMMLDQFQKGGFPDVIETRVAISNPEMLNADLGSGGSSFGLMDPAGGVILDPLNPHNTYLAASPGTYFGGMQPRFSTEELFPTFYEQRRLLSADPTDDWYTFGRSIPTQRFDQEWLDKIMPLYEQRMKELTGKKKGGLAEGGVPEKRDVSQLFPLKWSADANLHKGRTGVWTDTNDVFTGAMSGLFNTLAGGLRGRVIGTAGIPGDIIEGMSDLEGALPAMERKPKGQTFPQTYKAPPAFKLPTMEDLDTMLPSAGDSHEAKIAQELGQFMPLTGEELAPAGRALVSSAKKLAPTAAEMALDVASKYGVDPRMNIIKPKGGNWLSGSVDDATKRVKRYSSPPINREAELLAEVEEANKLNLPGYLNAATNDLQQLRIDMAADKWVEKKLNPYIKNEMGTETDPIRLGIERRAAEGEKLKQINQTRLAKMEADIAKAKAAGKDTTLSEGDLEKAREKFANEEYIATQGLFHKTIPEAGWTEPPPPQPYLTKRREREGMPIEDISTHPAAKRWERSVDMEMEPIKASRYQEDQNILDKNPYLSKLAPDSSVYSLDAMSDATFEFRHMMDEVKEAMNPQTVLPKSLRISPKDLEKMTVDDVSALSGKISAWRDTQKVKANLEADKNPAIHLFKEYTENNPKGVSWRQIKLPEGLPENEAKALVREATEYEGEMMRHCVGGAGHCEPLLNGEVEIYSLRDAKGEPHVTIEVEPNKYAPRHEEVQKYMALAEEEAKRLPNGYTSKDIEDIAINMAKKAMPSKILEIKGKNNRKPNPEYIPFVQDFVKSGKFSSVGDLKNTDLFSVDGKYFTEPELVEAAKKYGRMGVHDTTWEVSRKRHLDAGVSEEEALQNWVEAFKEGRGRLAIPRQDYAQGGAVRMAEGGVINLDDLVAQALSKNVTVNLDDMVHQALTKRFAKGGAAYNAI